MGTPVSGAPAFAQETPGQIQSVCFSLVTFALALTKCSAPAYKHMHPVPILLGPDYGARGTVQLVHCDGQLAGPDVFSAVENWDATT